MDTTHTGSMFFEDTRQGERWGGHRLCLSEDSSVQMDLYWSCNCTALQYSVNRFSISHSSVRHVPERSWTVVAVPCFTVVKSFTCRYASYCCFSSDFPKSHSTLFQSSFNCLFMHLLMLLLTSLYQPCPFGLCQDHLVKCSPTQDH